MRYKVFDLETQTNNLRKRKASPWHPDNYVVLRAWKNQGDTRCSWKYYKGHNRDHLRIEPDVTLLVGFNIKFDLLWEMACGNPDLKAFYERGGKVWDCQYAEYLIQAQDQEYHMCALDDVAEKYGGRKKIDVIKAMWKSGVETSDISEDLLVDYAVGTEDENRDSGDIGNTEKVFLGQIKIVAQMKMMPAVMARMDGLACTTEMEFNGIKVDIKEAARRLRVLEADLRTAQDSLSSYIPELPDGLEFNWGSRFHKSALIFGGTVKYEKQAPYTDPETGELARKKATEDWPLFDGEPADPKQGPQGLWDYSSETGLWEYNGHNQDTYISGKKKGQGKFKKVDVPGEIKQKYQDFFFKFQGYTEGDPAWATSDTDAAGQPVYSTNTDVMAELFTRDIPFTEALEKHSSLIKEIGTYYVRIDPKSGEMQGMLTCVSPSDHVIHHKLNHTSTVTTRLSSSDPNLQNVPRGDKSEIKKVFISRFGDDGVVVEADYSQLEVVVQGVLSKDEQLCKDLRDRVDFHCKRVAAKFGIDYEEALGLCKTEDGPEYKTWKKRRTDCKEFSFQRAYGAGSKAIAHSTGMSVDDIDAMIKAEDEMYPGVLRYNADVAKEVADSAVAFRDRTRNFKVYRQGFYVAPTGCRYKFRSYDAPAFMERRGVQDTFSPPEMKNYPVQGTGGEIVQLVLGKLWRHFVSNKNYGGKALLINTVHDCVWIDCHKDVLHQVAADVKRIMESVPEFMQATFGMKITVPFPVEVEAGPNMYTLSHIH